MLKTKQTRFTSVTRPTPIRKPVPVPALSADLRDWEREVYADPCGGAPSSY